MEQPELNIGNIARGAVPEIFDRAINEVLSNIADTNTVADAKRKVTLSFEFKPDTKREVATVVFSCETKLCGAEAASSQVYIVRRAGKAVGLADQDPRQIALFHQPVDSKEKN